MSFSPEDVVGRECRHVTYCKSNEVDDYGDMLVVKEQVHLKDGTVVPNLRFVENYKRSFWITKPGFRKHNDKKTAEDVNKLQRFSCTQRGLVKAISKALNYYSPNLSLRTLSRSPYLYGADIPSAVLLKAQYKEKWSDLISLNSVAVLDIETDVNHGTEQILSISLTYKDKAFLVWNKWFIDKEKKVVERTHEMFEKYLGDVKKKRGIELEVVIADTPGQCVVETMKRAHEWQPDFISIWNMNFDVPRMEKALIMEHIDPATVFSDPSVPDKYKFYRYKEGPAQKVTVSGKVMPLHPADRWHTAFAPASFYFIDSMCVYKKLRLAKGNQPSYSLDYILNKHLGIRKLKFKETDQYVGLRWHQVMQADYKIEYGIYNLFDCIGVEMLDEDPKVGDLSSTISVLTGNSEYDRFGSQPRRIADALHFYYMNEKNKIIATTADEMVEDLDKYVLPMTDWIVTLPTYLVDENGHTALEELPEVRTMIRTHTSDLDVEGAYPTGEIIMNISKETTARELCKFRGVDMQLQRRCGINLTGGVVNSLEICHDIFKLPTYDTLLDDFMSQDEK